MQLTPWQKQWEMVTMSAPESHEPATDSAHDHDDDHAPAPPPEPRTPMWLPALGAFLFLVAALLWATKGGGN